MIWEVKAEFLASCFAHGEIQLPFWHPVWCRLLIPIQKQLKLAGTICLHSCSSKSHLWNKRPGVGTGTPGSISFQTSLPNARGPPASWPSPAAALGVCQTMALLDFCTDWGLLGLQPWKRIMEIQGKKVCWGRGCHCSLLSLKCHQRREENAVHGREKASWGRDDLSYRTSWLSINFGCKWGYSLMYDEGRSSTASTGKQGREKPLLLSRSLISWCDRNQKEEELLTEEILQTPHLYLCPSPWYTNNELSSLNYCVTNYHDDHESWHTALSAPTTCVPWTAKRFPSVIYVPVWHF